MAAPVIQFKRGAFANLPALRAGEPGFTTDKYDLYVGLTSETSTNKFFGSHRYWGREDGNTSLKLKLVDKDGTNGIHLKSPNSVSGIGTYTLPDTNTIVDGYFLRVAADGTLSWSNDIDSSGATFVNSTLTGITTITGSVNATGSQINAGIITSTDFYIDATRVLYDDGSGITLAGIQTIDATTKTTLETILAFAPNEFTSLSVSGIATVGGLIDGNGGADISGQTELDGLNVSVAATFATATVGTGVGITQFSSSVSTGTSTSSVPTSSAVIDYVGTQIGNVDLTLGIDADTGGPSTVNTSQTLTINGTTSEIETSVSGQTITVGLPDAVVVGTSLSAPTVKAATLQHSNGTQAAVVDVSGNITASQNLTVTGNLYVSGSTTQVNTDTLTVEDRTIELGMVGGAAPTGATTWDLGVLFNYFSDSAKKSALVWEHSVGRFQLGSVVTDGGGTDSNSPQITVSTFAPIEVAELWVNNTCTGGTKQVIGCVGAELQLQNIVVDGGTFD